MRKFYLENSIGERKDLQLRKFFFHSPKGLGVSYKSEYEQLGNGFYDSSFMEAEQINIVGEIAFLESAYDDFQDLIDWIYSGYDLSFIYAPDGSTEYYCDIDVDYIEKEEIDYDSGTLKCPCSFLGKTAWYKATPTVMNFGLDPEIDYMVFDFPIESKFALSDSYNSLDITNAGHYPAYVKLTANGEMGNPILTLTNKSTGAVLGKLDLTGVTVDAGEMLKYSSVPGDSYITLVAADLTETDLIDLIDLSNDNFFSIPLNTVCTLKFEFTGPSQTSTLYVYEYRRTI
jgi:hypothetical protein